MASSCPECWGATTKKQIRAAGMCAGCVIRAERPDNWIETATPQAREFIKTSGMHPVNCAAAMNRAAIPPPRGWEKWTEHLVIAVEAQSLNWPRNTEEAHQMADAFCRAGAILPDQLVAAMNREHQDDEEDA